MARDAVVIPGASADSRSSEANTERDTTGARTLRAAVAEAVRYWDLEGRPDRMDAAQNGTPCQTVYDSSEVSSYWGLATAVYDLSSGLFCRDLKARGYSYDDAVWYWYLEGQTDRMDASGNGIPCQTVYPRAAVNAYWWR